MTIADPDTVSSSTAATPNDGITTGDCSTDSLTGIFYTECPNKKFPVTLGTIIFT